MKKTIKSISVLLTVLLALSAFAAVVFAADENVLLTGTAGTGITWMLTDDGVLTVSGNGPIEDEIAYDYDDDGEIVSWQTLNSIAFSLTEYYDGQTAGMDVAAAERFRFNLVREIVIEEGITVIPDGEFDGFYPRKVTLPASLKALGLQAFNASLASEVVIRSASLESAQFTVAVYRADAEPYADPDAAIEDLVAKRVREEQFQKDILPIYALQELFSIENGLLEASDEELADIYAYYNEAFGSDAETADELESVALGLLNGRFGTEYTDKNELFRIEQNEWDWEPEVVWAEELEAAYMAEADILYNDDRMISATLGEEFSDGEKAYGWLTVTAPGDSEIKDACERTGVTFADLYEGLCKWCHKDHSGNLWQKFVGFIHRILYFFAHLFGRK